MPLTCCSWKSNWTAGAGLGPGLGVGAPSAPWPGGAVMRALEPNPNDQNPENKSSVVRIRTGWASLSGPMVGFERHGQRGVVAKYWPETCKEEWYSGGSLLLIAGIRTVPLKKKTFFLGKREREKVEVGGGRESVERWKWGWSSDFPVFPSVFLLGKGGGGSFLKQGTNEYLLAFPFLSFLFFHIFQHTPTNIQNTMIMDDPSSDYSFNRRFSLLIRLEIRDLSKDEGRGSNIKLDFVLLFGLVWLGSHFVCYSPHPWRDSFLCRYLWVLAQG